MSRKIDLEPVINLYNGLMSSNWNANTCISSTIKHKAICKRDRINTFYHRFHSIFISILRQSICGAKHWRVFPASIPAQDYISSGALNICIAAAAAIRITFAPLRYIMHSHYLNRIRLISCLSRQPPAGMLASLLSWILLYCDHTVAAGSGTRKLDFAQINLWSYDICKLILLTGTVADLKKSLARPPATYFYACALWYSGDITFLQISENYYVEAYPFWMVRHIITIIWVYWNAASRLF